MSRQNRLIATTDLLQKAFVDKGMCIYVELSTKKEDKGKSVIPCAFIGDATIPIQDRGQQRNQRRTEFDKGNENGNSIVVDESQRTSDGWQDKEPDRLPESNPRARVKMSPEKFGLKEPINLMEKR